MWPPTDDVDGSHDAASISGLRALCPRVWHMTAGASDWLKLFLFYFRTVLTTRHCFEISWTTPLSYCGDSGAVTLSYFIFCAHLLLHCYIYSSDGLIRAEEKKKSLHPCDTHVNYVNDSIFNLMTKLDIRIQTLQILCCRNWKWKKVKCT